MSVIDKAVRILKALEREEVYDGEHVLGTLTVVRKLLGDEISSLTKELAESDAPVLRGQKKLPLEEKPPAPTIAVTVDGKGKFLTPADLTSESNPSDYVAPAEAPAEEPVF